MWFFFFKQKTAYEMLRSLVGSEMCIRDRIHGNRVPPDDKDDRDERGDGMEMTIDEDQEEEDNCLLYTSDAADDLLCVDLGGRRIIKKKQLISTSTRYNLPK